MANRALAQGACTLLSCTAPGFDKKRWLSMSDKTWASGVHKFYGTPFQAD